jgi:hypothetical protein
MEARSRRKLLEVVEAHARPALEKSRAFEPPHFEPPGWDGMAPHPARTGRIARRLFSNCHLPVASLVSANYLPVILLFRTRRRILTNLLKTINFRLILKARITPEQGETGSEQGQ